VFDEYTPQSEVYRESLSNVPRKLLGGINCAVLAYGQTGTGKTHTMLGEGLGIEMNVRAKQGGEILPPVKPPSREDGSEIKLRPDKHPDMTEGMIPRVVAQIFRLLGDTPESIEYTIRCSYVEIYLEKLSDLLQPWREDVRIGRAEDGDACIVGASELCCMAPCDVYALLARGNAYRTTAATD
jgi:kinesin family protein 5